MLSVYQVSGYCRSVRLQNTREDGDWGNDVGFTFYLAAESLAEVEESVRQEARLVFLETYPEDHRPLEVQITKLKVMPGSRIIGDATYAQRRPQSQARS